MTQEERNQKILKLHLYENKQRQVVEDWKPCTCGDSHCESCNEQFPGTRPRVAHAPINIPVTPLFNPAVKLTVI